MKIIEKQADRAQVCMVGVNAMDLQPNHTFTTDDGSDLKVILSDSGDIFPPFAGIVERVKKLKDLDLREDDIIVVSYPKSGTNWVSNLVTMIKHREKFAADRNCDMPERFLLEMHDQVMFAQAPSPRMMLTHVRSKFLPKSLVQPGKGKMIYVTRNPKDTVVSLYYSLQKIGIYEGTLGGVFESFLNGKLPYGNWFEYIDSYNKFNAAMKDRVCVMVYEDLKKDPSKELKRLATFLGVVLTYEEIDLFLNISSVSNMTSRYKAKTDVMSKVFRTFYRKGIIGDWKNHFTDAMNASFDAEYKRRMDDIDISYEFE